MKLNPNIPALLRPLKMCAAMVKFGAELKDVRRFGEVNKGSPLFSLSPFLDEENILRVEGRLQASELSKAAKHAFHQTP